MLGEYGDDSVAQLGRRPRRLRVGLEPAHEGDRAPAPRRLPRAVNALHSLRPAGPRARLPLLPQPGARGPSTSARWTRCSRTTGRRWQRSGPGSPSASRAARDSRPPRPRARRPRQGARPRPRAAAGRDALARRRLRERADLRAARDAPARRASCPRRATAAELLLAALRTVVPAFMTRVDRPDRGGAWTAFLRRARGGRGGRGRAARPRPSRSRTAAPGRTCACCTSTATSALLLARAAVRARRRRRGADRRRGRRARRGRSAAALLGELLSGRENRRHLPGRGLEALRYRFEIVSDYGAFRDLQRHRMLTAQWQALGPHLGAERPRGGGTPPASAPRFEARVRALARGLAAARGRGARTRRPPTRCAWRSASATCST